MVHKYGMVLSNTPSNSITRQPHISPTPALNFEMMSANKLVKTVKTNTVGTQTDPVSVSLKSRREMGFKLYPIDAGGESDMVRSDKRVTRVIMTGPIMNSLVHDWQCSRIIQPSNYELLNQEDTMDPKKCDDTDTDSISWMDDYWISR